MRAYRAKDMADSKADLLAGAGGLVTDEAQSDHQGRKALLLVRNNEDCDEFIALAKTMGINIVDRVDQRGRSDAKWFLGQGKLADTKTHREGCSGIKSDQHGHQVGQQPWVWLRPPSLPQH